MHPSALVFLRFLQRDIYSYRQRVYTYLINYAVIYPVLYAFAIGYLQSNSYFGNNPLQGSSLLIGHLLIIIIVFANMLNIGLLFDFENHRFIDYQVTLLNPRLILLERILFASIFTFAISMPFFPIAKLVLGDAFVTTQTSWLKTFLMLFVSSLFCATYTQFMVCIIPNSRKLRSYWMRINFVLNTLGGLFIPWYVINKLSLTLGSIALINPLLYITEGLRQSILAQPEYLPFWLCICMLLIFAIAFTLLSFHFFKKRVDHI
ncbi:MAG: ABC transporter permease [Candidatus Babeliales bacterium]|nr:ABC transporter permease [Candidatus Babeliales bacterium]